MRSCWLVVAVLSACGDRSPEKSDAGVSDAVTIDAEADAPVDAPPDAPPLPSQCSTTAEVIVDVRPSQVASFAVQGDVLYYATYRLNPATQEVLDGELQAIDLVTRLPAMTPMTSTTAITLRTGVGGVYAADASTVWRLQNGVAPSAIVTGRNRVDIATADTTHVYWAELTAAGGDDVVFRQSLAGGNVEQVMTCDGPFGLIVTDTDVYCAAFSDSELVYAPKTGGAQNVLVDPTVTRYPVLGLQRENNVLFYVDTSPNPQVYRAPLPTGPAQRILQSAEVTRFYGLAVGPNYFYMTGSATKRINRVTHDNETIYTGSGENPQFWNGKLVLATTDPNLAGERFITTCVD